MTNPTRAVPDMTLPISLETYYQLLSASADTGFKKEIWEIGAAAIHDWLARNDPAAFGMPILSGYQWKQLFLPNGTVLRTVFEGKNYHCMVEDGQIRYEGRTMSPSGFANAMGGTRRNAWKVLWLLFPDSGTWKLAGSLRPKRAVRSRQPR